MLEEVGIWNPHPDLIFKHRLFESLSLKESIETIVHTRCTLLREGLLRVTIRLGLLLCLPCAIRGFSELAVIVTSVARHFLPEPFGLFKGGIH